MIPVTFLIAGVQKCGTSALDAYLRHNDKVEMASPKETHFFDRESGVDWRAPDYGVLERHYQREVAVRGEATPITLYWTPAHYRVLRYNPDMKFILLFRDPVERAWSHWKMNKANGWDNLGFSDAIRHGRLRVLDEAGPNGLSRRLSYVERGYYGRQLDELMKLFPKEHCLFLKQEDLKVDPQSVVQQATDFLGVPPGTIGQHKTVNASRWTDDVAMSDEDRDYLSGLYSEDQKRFEEITGLKL